MTAYRLTVGKHVITPSGRTAMVVARLQPPYVRLVYKQGNGKLAIGSRLAERDEVDLPEHLLKEAE